MSSTLRFATCLGLVAASASVVAGQTCLGYPALAAGPVNVTGSASVGTEWWGATAHANVSPKRGPYFGGASFGVIKFVDEPVETRLSWGLLGGYHWMSRGQLHACPFVTAGFERGQFVKRNNGDRTRIHGRVLGIGVALAGEQQNRRFRSFSIAPFVSARLTHIVTNEDFDDGTARDNDDTGASVVAGLGFRLRDAIQITPMFATSTFENADLVFTLRFSVALQGRQ